MEGGGKGGWIGAGLSGSSASWEPTRRVSLALLSPVYYHGRWMDPRPQRETSSVVVSQLEVIRQEDSGMERTISGVVTQHAARTCHFEVRGATIRRFLHFFLQSCSYL